MAWSLTVKTESGDDYGPWLFDKKPTDDEIEAVLREDCPAEWACYEDGDGPGFRGSYCHVRLVDAGDVRRKSKRKAKR